jgi:hypothetical protein
MKAIESNDDVREPERAALAEDVGGKPQAWELIDKGRYRPRRIRGSLLGRELG